MKAFVFILACLVPAVASAATWNFTTPLVAPTPAAEAGAGLSLSPAPAVFTFSDLQEPAGTAASLPVRWELGTDATLVALAGPVCRDGSCGVSRQPVRNLAQRTGRAIASRSQRLFSRRPMRSFLGRLFGGCGLGGCN